MSTSALRSMRINSNKCIERIVLPPPTGSSSTQFTDPAITFSNLSATAGKPHIGVLFVAPGMYWGREENHKLEQEVAAAYGRYIGGKLIAVGCNETATENIDELRSCAGPQSPASGAPGLLFWPSDGLRVRVSHDDVALHRYSCGEQQHLLPGHIENLVGELGFEDREDSTLLVFANAFPAYITATACLFNAIQTRCRGKRMNLWGGYFNDDVSIAENVGTDNNCLVKDAVFVLIRLTSPRLNSVATIIRCGNPRLEVDRQLRQLNSRLNRRRRCIMLISGPVKIDAGNDGYPDCREFKAAARRIFSRDVQILGAFSNMPHAIGVGSSTHHSNMDQRYLWHNCMSVMILTYD